MKNSIFINALNNKKSGRVPFIPAIYEHKAWFIHQTPSQVCKGPELFFRALMAEYEIVRADALTIGLDVYNIEAEALGCTVTYYSGDDVSIPAIPADGHLHYPGVDEFLKMPVPNPLKSGRMPVNIEVTKRIVKELEDEIPVRGAVSGPFSLAVMLFGVEEIFILAMNDPDELRKVLQKCSDVIQEYGKAFIDSGSGIIVFDSQATPELISPSMYGKLIMPFHKQLIDCFKNLGCEHVPLIIGGNTTSIIDDYIGTGANNILCDARSDHSVFLEKCSTVNRAYRRNIPSDGFQDLNTERLYETAAQYIKEAQSYRGFILGTGVVPYGTPTENLLAVRRAVFENANT